MKYLALIWKKFTDTNQTKRLPTVKYMFPLVLGFVAVLSASVINSQSSYIRLNPSQTVVMKGERFSIDIYASAQVPVNALDVTIDFSSDKVQVISVDKAQSVLTIWTQEPVITEDKIYFGGGTFKKGFIGEHLIATIKVQAKFSGTTEFMVSNAQLLAGDGKGTPVAVTGIGTGSATSFYIYDQSEDPTKISAKLGVSIQADIDNDGKVTLKDISMFMTAWHSQNTSYDFNNDGRMNFIDFSIILAKSFMN